MSVTVAVRSLRCAVAAGVRRARARGVAVAVAVRRARRGRTARAPRSVRRGRAGGVTVAVAVGGRRRAVAARLGLRGSRDVAVAVAVSSLLCAVGASHGLCGSRDMAVAVALRLLGAGRLARQRQAEEGERTSKQEFLHRCKSFGWCVGRPSVHFRSVPLLQMYTLFFKVQSTAPLF